MTVRVGINGFGRIGRSFTRALLDRGADAGVELVAVNDPMGDSATMAFLLKHDSVGGTLQHEVKANDTGFSVDGREVRKLEVMDPAEIPWGEHGVDVVIESTGLFTAREKAAAHLQGGARRVIISAPSGDADATICMGVNDPVFDPAAHTVISNASCTTNCLGPLAKVVNDRFGIEQGLMTTVHAYTSDQSLQDLAHPTRKGAPDLRRMRAAALSIIPASSGAPGPSASCSPSCKAASTASRPGPHPSRVDHRPQRPGARTGLPGRSQRGVRRSRQRCRLPRGARVQRRAAGVGRHRREPRVVHLLGQGHDGERQDGEGARLVRQRMGLLQPSR